MVVYKTLRRLKRNSTVTIGNFDGFHLGHQRIVKQLVEHSRQRRHLSVILTFFPHPRIFLGHDIRLIFTDNQKREILLGQPVGRLFFIDFPCLQAITAAQFIEEILVGCLRMKTLVFSGDFLFGSGRSGNVALLQAAADRFGFELAQVEPVISGGERVSSSAIRKKLQQGEIASANRMLGRPYVIDGMVEPGEGRGRKIGFPTINIRTENRLLPHGVFHTAIEIGKKRLASVTNIGVRPTFEPAAELRVETHIPGFKKNLYGRKVRLHFLDKIRDEMRFGTEEQLKRQIAADIAISLKEGPL